MKDPELFSTINIEQLLSTIENDKINYLENKNMKIITDDIFHIIKRLNATTQTKLSICNKLSGYRYVDEIRDLHKGKHTRWIRKNNDNPVLTNGGTLVNILFNDTGSAIVCKTYMNKFFQCKYDDCFIFQKLSTEEQVILMAYEYIENKSK